jgi:hypothetical protein
MSTDPNAIKCVHAGPNYLGSAEFGVARLFGRKVWVVHDGAGNEFVCIVCEATEKIILERAGCLHAQAGVPDLFLPMMAFATGRAYELWDRWHGEGGYYEHFC